MQRRRLTRAPLDAALARRALELAQPSIEAALAAPGVSGEQALHVVVLDPQARPGHGQSFEAALLAEAAFGRPPPHSVDYREYARDKARLAWRLQADTRWVHQQAPHLLHAGDSTLWGSAVADGMIVAASGAQPWFDEALCGVVLALLRGLVQDQLRAAHD